MKNKIVFISLFIGCYLCFLVATLPAHVAMQFISLPKTVQLSEAKGSIWQVEFESINYQGFAVSNISADMSPLSLLILSPKIDLNFGGSLLAGPKGQASLSYIFGTITVEDATIDIAASEIAPYLLLPVPVDAFGNVSLALTELEVDEQLQCQQAQGALSWQRAAATAMEQTVELGDFNGVISCQKGAFALTINPDNHLGLTYSASVNAKGQLNGQGFVKPGAKFPQQLKQALPFIGNPDNQGRYQLKL